MRKSDPLSSGSPATFWAMPTMKGLMGLKVAPTTAAPMLMATAVTRLKPSLATSRTRMGAKAISSSCIWMSTPPVANTTQEIGMTKASWPRNCSIRASSSVPNTPVRSTTVQAAPTRKTRKMTEAASAIPFGMATRASSGHTGAGFTVR